MKVYIYKGGQSLVAKSGVGSAIRHQEKMLRAAGVTVTDVWKEADVVQINTVLPDSPLVARRARRQGKKVVYYGHSTMEDFKNSFIGSNLAAPLFKMDLSLLSTGRCGHYAYGVFQRIVTELWTVSQNLCTDQRRRHRIFPQNRAGKWTISSSFSYSCG